MNVNENQYINPFGLDVKIVNISSEICLPKNVADEVLNQVEKGKKLAKDFSEKIIFNSNTKLYKAIAENHCKSFLNSKKSCIAKNKKYGAQAKVEVNINIIGALNSFCLKTGIAVDYKKAFKFPINQSLLSICHADGRKQASKKSDLKGILKSVQNLLLEKVVSMCSRVVIVDLMGLINKLNSIIHI